MYRAVTRDIQVTVTPAFLAERSEPDEGRYFWAYTVEIVNLAVAESLDDPPRIFELVAKVVPRLTAQQSVTPRLGHRSTPTSGRTPNRSV